MKSTVPSLTLDMCFVANRDVSQKSKQSCSVDPNEKADNEPSQQDLHCLYRYLVWCVENITLVHDNKKKL